MNCPALPALLFLGTILVSGVGCAGTLYKSVSPDGTVLYSDQPRADGKVQKTITFTELPATPLPESVIRYRQALQKSMQNRLTSAQKPSGGSAQLFTAQWCGYCRKAKAYLGEKGVGYQEHDIDTPEGRLAFAQVSILTACGQYPPLAGRWNQCEERQHYLSKLTFYSTKASLPPRPTPILITSRKPPIAVPFHCLPLLHELEAAIDRAVRTTADGQPPRP